MKYVLAAACAAAALSATPALAGDLAWYGNAKFDTVNTGGLNFRTLGGRVGARTEHLGVEGEAAFGVGDTDVGSGVTAKLSNQYGLFAVAYMPSGENGDLFVRGGYGRAEVEASGFGGSASASDNMWMAGVGGQWFSGKNGVRFDVTHAWWDAGGDSDTISIAYVRKFGK